MVDYQIHSETDIKNEARRLILEQIRSSREILSDPDLDDDKRIHEVRKCFKRIRAVLRLIRDAIGYSNYYRENVFFRDLGGSLSAARDAGVIFERGEYMLNEFPELENDKSFGEFLSGLEKEKNRKTREIKNKNLFTQVDDQLNQSIQRFEKLSIQNSGFGVIAGGLKRMYKHGRKYLKKLRKESDSETIHNLRKRSKYLWYHMQLIQPVYPKLIGAHEKTLDKISEELGFYRDVYLFLKRFRKEGFYKNNPEMGKKIEEYYERVSLESLNTAAIEAEKFFMEKPGAFVRRFKKYWELSLVLKVNQVI
jgi:CHAD domain-containing protein